MSGLGYGIGKGVAGALWTPRKISSLTAWLRADRGVTKTGSDVTDWADPATGKHFPQTVAGDYPQFVLDTVFNNHPSLDFDGASDRLGTKTFYNDMPNRDGVVSAAVGEIWVVTKPDTLPAWTPANPFVTDCALWSTTQGLDPFCGLNDTTVDGVLYDGSFNTVRVTANAANAAIITWRWNSTNFTIDFVSTSETQSGNVAAGASTQGNSTFAVGFTPQWSVFYDGRLAEMLFFNGELSSGDRAKVTNYLRNRYGI